MRCPACRTVMIVVERHAIEVDWCPDCRGMWFDEGELELLGERAGMVISPASLFEEGGQAGPRRCPRCSDKMQQFDAAESSGRPVPIDRCRAHGLWLDRGELSRLVCGRTASHGADESAMLDFLEETFAVAGEPTSGEIL